MESLRHVLLQKIALLERRFAIWRLERKFSISQYYKGAFSQGFAISTSETFGCNRAVNIVKVYVNNAALQEATKMRVHFLFGLTFKQA